MAEGKALKKCGYCNRILLPQKQVDGQGNWFDEEVWSNEMQVRNVVGDSYDALTFTPYVCDQNVCRRRHAEDQKAKDAQQIKAAVAATEAVIRADVTPQAPQEVPAAELSKARLDAIVDAIEEQTGVLRRIEKLLAKEES